MSSQPFRISQRLAPIKPSITLAVTARAAKLRADGIDVIGFGAGEPDFDTPTHIKDAAKRALDAGDTKYTAVAGTLPLRKAIVKEMQSAHGLTFTPEQVSVAVGAKHSLYNIFHCLLDKDDEVIIPAPYWVSYPDIVLLAGGKPVIIPTTAETGFRITPEQLEKAITPKTRAFILCSPSNPTGAGYDRAALEALRPIFEKHNLVVVSDDIYRRLVYRDFKFTQIATLSPKMAELTVVVDGLSKAYAMTGWRLGYTCGPKVLIDAMNTLQGQSTSNVTSIAQARRVRQAPRAHRRAPARHPRRHLLRPRGRLLRLPQRGRLRGQVDQGRQGDQGRRRPLRVPARRRQGRRGARLRLRRPRLRPPLVRHLHEGHRVRRRPHRRHPRRPLLAPAGPSGVTLPPATH